MDRISKIGIAVSIALLVGLYAFQIQKTKKAKGEPPQSSTKPVTVRPEEIAEEKTPPPEPVAHADVEVKEGKEAGTELGWGGKFPATDEAVLIETDLLSATLSGYGGVLRRVVLKESPVHGIRKLQGEATGDVVLFNQDEVLRCTGAFLDPEIPPVAMTVRRSGLTAEFRCRYDNNIELSKMYTFSEQSYTAGLKVIISNGSDRTIEWDDERSLDLVCGTLYQIDGKDDILGVDVLTSDGSVIRSDRPVEQSPKSMVWLGLKTKYFAAICEPEKAAAFFEVTGVPKETRSASRAALGCAGGPGPARFQYLTASLGFKGVLKPGEKAEYNFLFYFGPADYRTLMSSGQGFEKIINLGTFFIITWVSKGLIWLLDEIYGIIHSYGWSIIFMTMIAKLVIWPLTHKSMKSMREMQKLQPQLSVLKEKYKNDAKKMQAEMMKIYKEHGVSPWGGCLPMVIQLPILVALFNSLRNTILLRKAPFWIVPNHWIRDLSGPDAFYRFQQPVKLLLFEIDQINILPLLMGVSFFLQQKIMPQASAGNPQSEQQQKMMGMMMPVLFLFIFYSLPAGLNLYFLVSTLTSVIGQMYMMRRKKA